MSGWLRFEDAAPESPSLVALSDKAFRLWFNACCYCHRNKTDGLVPASLAAALSHTATKRTVDELVDAEKFEERPGGFFYVHDYLEHNPSKVRIAEMKEAAKKRTESWRVTRHESNSDASQTSHSRGRARAESVSVGVEPSATSTDHHENDAGGREPANDTVDFLCELLAELILENDPKAKVAPGSDAWRRPMRLLLADRDGDAGEVERVLRWCQADSFWQTNVLSPRKLREQFTQLALKARNGPASRRDGQKASVAKRNQFIEHD